MIEQMKAAGWVSKWYATGPGPISELIMTCKAMNEGGTPTVLVPEKNGMHLLIARLEGSE